MSLKLMYNHARFTRSSGFTLIEVAMGLMIASIILIPFLQIQRMQRMTDASVDTYQYLNSTIVPSLKSYALLHGVFPPPAPPKGDLTSADPATLAAAATGDPFSKTMGCPSTTAGGIVCVMSNGKPVVIGALPAQDLGIPVEKALDRYGHKYLYAVSQDHIDETLKMGMTTGGWINIRNSVNFYIAGPYTSTSQEYLNATFVILSFGEDGIGAYMANGTRNPCTAAYAFEKINCDDDGTFFRLTEPYDANTTATAVKGVDKYNLNNRTPATYFDDSIVYDLSAGTTQWTQRPAGAGVGTFLTRDSVGAGKAVIGNPKNGSLQASLEVGTTAGGSNAMADNVYTNRLCDTQSAASSSACITTSSVGNVSDISLQCGNYAMKGLGNSTSIGTPVNGVTAAPPLNCDYAPVVPVTSTTLLNTVVTPCVNGAKSYNSDGSMTCY